MRFNATVDIENRGSSSCSLVGYFRSALGIGETARGYAAALASQGVAPNLVDISHLAPVAREEPPVPNHFLDSIPASDVVIFCNNALEHPDVTHQLAFSKEGQSGYVVGIWAWETPDFPEEWLERFDMVDEVWTGSSFIRDSISKQSPVPVLKMPYVVDVPIAEPDRSKFGLAEDELIILCAFDFHSFSQRKNPGASIEAFKLAFSNEEKVRLVVKTLNSSAQPANVESLESSVEGHNVTFIHEALSSKDRYALLASCDVFLSLHRAEGFGLGLAEAMAYGKVAIGTGWSGNLDFMNQENSILVQYEPTVLSKSAGPYPVGTVWAEPSVSDAAQKLRKISDDEGLRIRLGTKAQRDIQANFSPETVGKLMSERIERIVSHERSQLLKKKLLEKKLVFGRKVLIAFALVDFFTSPLKFFVRVNQLLQRKSSLRSSAQEWGLAFFEAHSCQE
jgi:glycosyltransferase involved in cell wall biosynthesis